jgi:hypothetical protein
MRKFTPSDIEVLIHCHCFAEPHPRLEAPAIKDTIRCFLKEDLIVPDNTKEHIFWTTDKGKKLIDMLCETPLPVLYQGWKDPREDE